MSKVKATIMQIDWPTTDADLKFNCSCGYSRDFSGFFTEKFVQCADCRKVFGIPMEIQVPEVEEQDVSGDIYDFLLEDELELTGDEGDALLEDERFSSEVETEDDEEDDLPN